MLRLGGERRAKEHRTRASKELAPVHQWVSSDGAWSQIASMQEPSLQAGRESISAEDRAREPRAVLTHRAIRAPLHHDEVEVAEASGKVRYEGMYGGPRSNPRATAGLGSVWDVSEGVESPGDTVVILIDRSDYFANPADYFVGFKEGAATRAVLLGSVEGLNALRGVLRKLNLTEPAVEAACMVLIEHSHYEISGVVLTPALIRELGVACLRLGQSPR